MGIISTLHCCVYDSKLFSSIDVFDFLWFYLYLNMHDVQCCIERYGTVYPGSIHLKLMDNKIHLNYAPDFKAYETKIDNRYVIFEKN